MHSSNTRVSHLRLSNEILGLESGYRIRFLMAGPLEIVMIPVWHPIFTSAMAIHDLHNMRGTPSILFLGKEPKFLLDTPKNPYR